jgi:hypothetical protein
MCLDVDLNPGANHGCLLNWRDPAFAPVHVVTAIHEKAFARAFVKGCSAKAAKPRSFNAKTRRRRGRSLDHGLAVLRNKGIFRILGDFV